MDNMIFYFSGTGNCLKIAKTIAKELGNGEIVSMAKSGKYVLSKQYDSIGFIYPVYFLGLPNKVVDFAGKLDFGNNKDTYCYAIAANGGNAGNALYQLYEILNEKHGVKLNYGEKFKLFSNYIVMYEKNRNAEKIAGEIDEKLVPIIDSIKEKKNNRISSLTKLMSFFSDMLTNTFSDLDKNHRIGDKCDGCGICKEVCPVKNIEMADNKPRFNHNCEHCMACIQYCPQTAIEYNDDTVNKERFTNPEISYKELAEWNNR